MILTCKIEHNRDFSQELTKAKKIAAYAIKVKYRIFSSKHVKHIGLKSAIANQILREYGRNKQTKQVKNIKLVIPNQSIRLDKETRTITIPFQHYFPAFEKVNQIEIGEEYTYVAVSVKEQHVIDTGKYLGVDLNTTGHVAIISNPGTGKVWKDCRTYP
jgi:putative transposase